MMVILAGAGASKAVDKKKYPCTVDFMNRLPATILDTALFKMILQSIQAEQPGVIIDVEVVLSALEVVATTCDQIGDPNSAVGYLFDQNRFRNIDDGLSDLTQSVTACKHIASRARTLAGQINEQVIRIYGAEPTASELTDNWLRLLPYLRDHNMDVELFSTNYDLVIEAAILASNSPLLTGRNQGIVTDLDLPLWGDDPAKAKAGLFTKLHGSVDWRREEDGRIYAGNKNWSGDHARQAIIYPAYKGEPNESPFREFQEHLKRAVREATEILVIGFAFRDGAINRAFEFRNPHARIAVIDPAPKINAPKSWNAEHIPKGFGAEGIANALMFLQPSTTSDSGLQAMAS